MKMLALSRTRIAQNGTTTCRLHRHAAGQQRRRATQQSRGQQTNKELVSLHEIQAFLQRP
jgi:hypothetical protein